MKKTLLLLTCRKVDQQECMDMLAVSWLSAAILVPLVSRLLCSTFGTWQSSAAPRAAANNSTIPLRESVSDGQAQNFALSRVEAATQQIWLVYACPAEHLCSSRKQPNTSLCGKRGDVSDLHRCASSNGQYPRSS